MKFNPLPHVNKEILDKSEKDIGHVNAYVDGLKGTVITIERIRSGQSAPYADAIYESLIFCHQPNTLTTNSPIARVIDIDQAKAIAKIFVHAWDDEPKNWASPVLEFIRPEPNPCGLDLVERNGFHCCWRVRIRLAYTD
jgi:hypothetical protein